MYYVLWYDNVKKCDRWNEVGALWIARSVLHTLESIPEMFNIHITEEVNI
jgi:hypothetical protein